MCALNRVATGGGAALKVLNRSGKIPPFADMAVACNQVWARLPRVQIVRDAPAMRWLPNPPRKPDILGLDRSHDGQQPSCVVVTLAAKMI